MWEGIDRRIKAVNIKIYCPSYPYHRQCISLTIGRNSGIQETRNKGGYRIRSLRKLSKWVGKLKDVMTKNVVNYEFLKSISLS